MPTMFASDNWVGLAVGSQPASRTANNARGGTGTAVWANTNAAHRVQVAVEGLLGPVTEQGNFYGGFAANTGYFDGEVRMLGDRNGGTNAIEVFNATTAAEGSFSNNTILARLQAGWTTLLVQNNTLASGTATGIVVPAGVNPIVGLLIQDFTATATVYNADTMAVIATRTITLTAARPRGTFWGGRYGAAATPIVSRLGWIELYTLATGATAPVIGSISVVKDGKTAADGTINSNGANGVVFYRWFVAGETPTEALVYAGTMANWTAAGAWAVPKQTGFAPGATVRLAAIRRDSGYNVGAMVVSSAVTLDPALPAPSGTVSAVRDGQVVTVSVAYTGTVSQISLSIPAADPANGAVAQGPISATPTGSPHVFAPLTLPPGNYAAESVLLINADNTVPISGTPYSILPISGTPEGPEPAATVPVVQAPFLAPSEILWGPVVGSPLAATVAPPFQTSAAQVWAPTLSLPSFGAQVVVPSFDCTEEFGAVAVTSVAAAILQVEFLPSDDQVWAPSLSLPASGLEVVFLDSAELLWEPTVEGLIGGFEGSLITMEQADKYVLEFYGADHAWFSVTASRKRIALRRATQYLLANYCIKPIYLAPLHKNVIAAAAEAAIRALSGALFEDQNAQHVESVTVGPISRKMSAPRAGGQKRFTVIDQLLRGLTCNSPGMVRFERA